VRSVRGSTAGLLIVVSLLVIVGCGGSRDEPAYRPGEDSQQDVGQAEDDLSSRQQYRVAKGREAISSVLAGDLSPEQAEAEVEALIRLCRKHPEGRYGQIELPSVLEQAAGDLGDMAPALAARLQQTAADGCA
jgi:hypothetical protein